MSDARANAARHRSELLRNGLAGSVAISIAVGTFNPLDTLRVRWQVATPAPTSGLLGYAKNIVAREGLVKGLWSPGLGANMCSFFVCGGFRQGLYPYFRDTLVVMSGAEEKSALTMIGGGFWAGAISFWMCTPFFQLKTLMQAEAGMICPSSGMLLTGARAGELPRFHGNMWWTNGLALGRDGGIAGLWRGACPLVFRGALLASGQMLGYDGCKTYCKRAGLLEDGPVLHVGASVAAAFLSCTFSAPADIVMTRYQAAQIIGRAYTGPIDCVKTMVREEGLRVFFRGTPTANCRRFHLLHPPLTLNPSAFQ